MVLTAVGGVGWGRGSSWAGSAAAAEDGDGMWALLQWDCIRGPQPPAAAHPPRGQGVSVGAASALMPLPAHSPPTHPPACPPGPHLKDGT